MSRYQSEAPDGQPTHTPKIRIHGVEPGSPRHNAIVDAYSGKLKQFHAAQQQQVKISGQRVYKASRHVPGAHLTYHNNEGQETIVMVVDSGGEEQKQEITKEEYWQWAIVETTIPDMTLTSAEMSAFMIPAPTGKIGVAWDDNENFDAVRPPLAYPDFEIATEINALSDQADQVSSLRVDLRPYPGGVKFDLYGFIHSYVDPDGLGPIVGSTFHAGRKANNITSGAWTGTWSNSNGGSGAFPSAADISGRTQGNVIYAGTTPALVQADFPETAAFTFSSTTTSGLNFLFAPYGAPWSGAGPGYAGISFIWTPGSGNMPDPTSLDVSGIISAAGGLFNETTTNYTEGFTKKVVGIGAMDYATIGGVETPLNGAGPTDATGNWGIEFFDYTLYHPSDHSELIVYPTRAAPVRFAVFDGETPDAYTQLSGFFGSRKRWEDSKRGVDKRWPFKQIAVANIQSIDDPVDTSQANHFGMIKLGTVIINPRKGRGGIKFIAA